MRKEIFLLMVVLIGIAAAFPQRVRDENKKKNGHIFHKAIVKTHQRPGQGHKRPSTGVQYAVLHPLIGPTKLTFPCSYWCSDPVKGKVCCDHL